MAAQLTTVMIGVESLVRSKKFYVEGLGCEIAQDYPHFVALNLGERSSSLALYPREAVAAGGDTVKEAAAT
jgi:catechol 2,3-dioxygenase-like lactoylglutathione lyase family enzyme